MPSTSSTATLAGDLAAVGAHGDEVDRLARGRQHRRVDAEGIGQRRDGRLDAAELGGEGGEHEVAGGVALEVALGEAVLQSAGETAPTVAGERGEAAADVARRRQPEVGPQPARAPAVVGDRHDRGELGPAPAGRAKVHASPWPPPMATTRGRALTASRRGGSPSARIPDRAAVSAISSATTTDRWRPPVQPTAIDR